MAQSKRKPDEPSRKVLRSRTLDRRLKSMLASLEQEPIPERLLKPAFELQAALKGRCRPKDRH